MSNYVNQAAEASEPYFAALTENQESFLRSMAATTAWIAASPPPTALASTEPPTMQEMIEANFSFAQKFFKQQQEFVEKIVAASARSAAATPMSAPPRNAPAKTRSATAS